MGTEIGVGSTLGHYRITAELGAGGMGEVYRAQDTMLKREVALKLLPAELVESAERLARFRREAEVLRRSTTPTSSPSIRWRRRRGCTSSPCSW